MTVVAITRRFARPGAAMLTAAAMVLAVGASTSSAANSVEGGEEVNLTVWVWSTTLLDAVIPTFEAEHPGVTVEQIEVGNPAIWDKITTGLAAGGEGMPDIMNTSVDYLPGFVENFPGGLADLNDLGAAEIADLFVPAAWDWAVIDGGVYGIPFEVNSAGFLYRPDLFEQAGVDYAEIETWEELFDAGVQIKAETGKFLIEINMAGTGTPVELWQTLTQQMGASYFDEDGNITVNGPEGVRAMELIKYANDLGVVGDQSVIGDLEYSLREYKEERLAVSLEASWFSGWLELAAPEAAGQWSAEIRPAVDPGGPRGALSGVNHLSISNYSDHKELAFEFVRYALATLEGVQAMQDAQPFTTGFMPIFDTPGFTEWPTDYFVGVSPMQAFVDSVTVDGLYAPYFTKDYAIAIRLLADAQTKVLTQGADPQDALDEVAELLAAQTGREIVSG